MKPIGPLMWEHRAIERVIGVFDSQILRMQRMNAIDVVFIDTAVDFIRTYADRTHHGKEEEILFRDLAKKDLSADHARIMAELIEEHTFARATTRKLVKARDRYVRGGNAPIDEVITLLRTISDFYPKHIEKEDWHFFYPAMEYFSEEEQAAMLQEFSEFDRKMIHEKYRQIADLLVQWE
jgi:hemerythrin-like domain-containing protein